MWCDGPLSRLPGGPHHNPMWAVLRSPLYSWGNWTWPEQYLAKGHAFQKWSCNQSSCIFKDYSPPIASSRSMEMPPHQALWSSTMPCPPMPNGLNSKTIRPIGFPERSMIPVSAAPCSYSVGPTCTFEWLHNPAVSSWKNISFSPCSWWNPLSLRASYGCR